MTGPADREQSAPTADPTRDIRLPPLPGRPAPVLPAAWARPLDEPTDRLRQPQGPRERTLAFSSPEMGQRPVGPVQVGRSSRRWPWVVLAVLPLLIIVGTGIWWLLLLRAA